MLMEGTMNRNAHFTTAIAFADEKGIFVFTGMIEGNVIF